MSVSIIVVSNFDSPDLLQLTQLVCNINYSNVSRPVTVAVVSLLVTVTL